MKKLLLITLCTTFLVSCGQNKNYTEKNLNNGFTTEGGTDNNQESIVVNALKEYHPSRNYDSTVNVNSTKLVTLPSTIEVLSGNSGNYYSIVYIDDSLVCYYKGGSSYSYPLQRGNQQDIEDGEQYHFSHCVENGNTSNLEANDLIEIKEKVKLSIHNGDSTVSTEIQLKLIVQ